MTTSTESEFPHEVLVELSNYFLNSSTNTGLDKDNGNSSQSSLNESDTPTQALSPKDEPHTHISMLQESQRFILGKVVLSCLLWENYKNDDSGLIRIIAKRTLSVYLQLSPESTEEITDLLNEGLCTPIYYSHFGPPIERPFNIIGELLLCGVLDNKYISIYRHMIMKLAETYMISRVSIYEFEVRLSETVLELYTALNNHEIEQQKLKLKKKSKWLKIGLVAGIGAIAGLATPIIAPALAIGFATVGTAFTAIGGSVGAIIGSSLAATGTYLATTTVGMSVLFNTLTIGGASYGGIKMKNRLKDIEDISIKDLSVSHRLNDIICVPGWLDDGFSQDIVWGISEQYPWWKNECKYGDVYLLEWEKDLLKKINSLFFDTTIQTVQKSIMLNLSQQLIFQNALVIALPLQILTPLSVLDNPWSSARNRAQSGGIVLAHIIMENNKCVSLYGYSLGSLMIYSCLLELYKQNKRGIIYDAVLLGLPAQVSEKEWKQIRAVVCNRVINGYTQNDWLLYYFHRIESFQATSCGMQSIPVDGIENYNLSQIVNGHLDYPMKMKEIFEHIGLATRIQVSKNQPKCAYSVSKDNVNSQNGVYIPPNN